MLHFILGPSGSGKSYQMLAELRTRAERGERSILIVPEQFTSSTEGVLYRTLGDSLSAYVDSYSFTSLSEALLRRYGGAAVPTLTEAGRALLLRRAADSLLDKVVYYSRQRRSAAFCEKAAQTISELKSAGVTPEMLAEYAKTPGADREKLDELALIYNAYEGLLAQSAMDPGDRQQRAAERLDAEFFAGRAVFIDEFDTFNAPKRALLAAMLPVADVTVCLCCDGEQDSDGGMGLFSGAKHVIHTLKRMANDANIPTYTEVLTADRRHAGTPALAELNLLLADPAYTPELTVDPAHPAITYHAAASRQAEAKAVAAEIAARARQGTPYSRMAVICRNADQYLAPLRYEFRLQNIPLFCDEATSPENTAPARAVHAALDLLRGVSSRSVLRLLKTGLVDLPDTQQCALENYAYTWPLTAADWRGTFTRSASGYAGRDTEQDVQTLADAEAARAFLMERVAAFVKKAAGAPAAALTKQLYLFLQSLGAEDALNRLAAALDILGTLTQDPGQGAAGAAVRAVLDESPDLAPGYEAVRRAADTAGAEQRVEDTAALEALLGPGLHISPTRFEKYQYCPFGYFLQYILKAAPRQKAELAPNISGTLTHWVLENALRRQGEAFKDLTPEELETLVNDLVDEYTAANLPGMTLRMEYLVGRIRRNLVGLLGFIQRDLRQSGFQPVAFELRIDDRPDADDPDAPRVDPVELDDGAGHTVRIVGTVDRVDAMPLEKLGRTYLRVVDYKTGGKEFKLKEVYCGLDCQMLLYLFTLERNAKRQFPGATAAGVEYLLADPAPKSVDRSELGDDADPAPTYPMNGLLLDEESIYRAMDTKGTGEFVPLSFSAKTGKPLNAKSTLADTAKLGRIRDHLDGLLIDMAKNLYSGRIDAEPLCTGGRSPCTYCEFRCACTHRDGEHERTINIKDDPFAE